MNKFKGALKFGKIRVLNVAEKPSVAKSIAQVLSNNYKTSETKSPYNKLFQFDYQLGEQNLEMWITSISGHLKQLKYTENYQNWEQWDPLFILKEAEVENEIPKDKQSLYFNLQNFSRQCERLILWLDCDREGENIAFEVLEVCKQANPTLEIFRAHFSAVTYRDIQKALNNLKQPDENLSNSVDARQEIDLRIGASFTRFQTVLLRKRFNLKTIVSYGPCQIPTLGFVAQRQKEIDSFIKEKFWYIQCEDQTGCIYGWNKGNMFDEMIVLILFERCYANVAKVTDIQQKDVQKYKPLPLSTIEFEKLVSKKLKISAHQAMQIAEKLYNKGFISYPRTETNKFPNTINLQDLIKQQLTHPVWGNYAQNLIDYNFDYPRGGDRDDKAHPPIHPVKQMQESDAENKEQWEVYQLITRHFLACCSKNAKGSETVINLKVEEEEFSKKGLTIKEKNYLEIYPYDEWNQQIIPFHQVNDTINIKLTVQSGKTSPPKPITEAELIGLMDKNGIGTDATIHEHIKTIQERGYAIKKGQILRPSKLGLALVESYENLGFTLHHPFLRAVMEQRMNEVAQGSKQKNDIIQTTIDEMVAILLELQQKQDQVLQIFGQYLEILRDYNENQGDEETPTQNTIIQQQQKQPQQSKQMQQKSKNQNNNNNNNNNNNEKTIRCSSCNGGMLIKRAKSNQSTFLGCSSYPQCKQLISLPPWISSIEQTNKKCQKCGSLLYTLQITEQHSQNYAQFKNKQVCLLPNCQALVSTRWRDQPTQNQNDNNGLVERPVASQNQQKVCSSCGVQGRHPNGSDCPLKKGKKKND